MSTMDVSAYLQRIKYTGDLKPDLKTLCALHLAHLQSVPFENLDVHLGRPITLDLTRLFDKIVRCRRGGFCYELNGLFASLLKHLGFVVTCLSASDARGNNEFGPDFDHLTLMVQEPDVPSTRWLADVGWGDTFREPLRLNDIGEQKQQQHVYRISIEDGYHLLWQRDDDGQWECQYRFTLQPRNYRDFADMCLYHQTSPESLFVQKRICTLATVEGRITLDNSRFITTVSGKRHEQLINDEATYQQILKERFGIAFDRVGYIEPPI